MVTKFLKKNNQLIKISIKMVILIEILYNKKVPLNNLLNVNIKNVAKK